MHEQRIMITALFSPTKAQKQTKLIFSAILPWNDAEKILDTTNLTAPELMILKHGEGIQVPIEFLEQIRSDDHKVNEDIPQAYISLSLLHARGIKPEEIELLLSTEEFVNGRPE